MTGAMPADLALFLATYIPARRKPVALPIYPKPWTRKQGDEPPF